MLIDAVHAGKDAYVEKPIMHSIEEGVEMVRAVEESKRIVQTGTQQRSWPHWIMGKQIVDSGKLGKITFVHTYWYQDYTLFFNGLHPGGPVATRLEALPRRRAGPAVYAGEILLVALVLGFWRRDIN